MMKSFAYMLLLCLSFAASEVKAEIDTLKALSSADVASVRFRKIEPLFPGVEREEKEEDTYDRGQQLILVYTAGSGREGEVVYHVEYCPDEKCELFMVWDAESYSPAADFFFLYMLYFFPYDYLVEYRNSSLERGLNIMPRHRERGLSAKPPVDLILKHDADGPKVLARYKSQCDRGSDNENAMCVVRHLCDKHSILIFGKNYYENAEAILDPTYPEGWGHDPCPDLTVDIVDEARRLKDEWKGER